MQIRRWVTSLASSFLIACALEACSAAPDVIFHTFAFDALLDSPGIEILDHRYGDSKFPGASNPEEMLKSGEALQGTMTTGEMRRPETLYVKWRVLSENKVYEDTVDLRSRLPRDIANCTVYFMVQGPQLYVYLIHPGPRPAGAPEIRLQAYRSRKVTTIYPDEPKR